MRFQEREFSMLSVSDALDMILLHVHSGSQESVSLTHSLSRVLAADLAVPSDSPPFDKALMDGFAVHSESVVKSSSDVHAETRTFRVVEVIAAGTTPSIPLGNGLASRIMTGAPLPDGCDCVVPIEQTMFDESAPESVTIPGGCIFPESNLMRCGTAARAGSKLLATGTRIQPQQIAALAEFGFASIPVYRKPLVAVLATGNELTPVNEALKPGSIRNSNEPMLIAQIEACGAVPLALGIARDEEASLQNAIQKGLQTDYFLLTGGVSAGLLDLVPQQLRRAGVSQVFHGVHMKPGKPLWFGKYERDLQRCLVFGLPGNPVSSLACFELFVRPALQRFSGLPDKVNSLTAVLTDFIQVKGDRPVYHPVHVSIQNGQLIAQPIPWSGSSDLRATVEANGMALLLVRHGLYKAGERVEVYLWGDQRLI